jgi:hypothetical protein
MDFCLFQTKLSVYISTTLGVCILGPACLWGISLFHLYLWLIFWVSFLTASTHGNSTWGIYALNANGHWIFKSFMWMILGWRLGDDALTSPCANLLKKRLWQLCVWLCQELQAICNKPCSQYRNLSCHWCLLNQPSGESVCVESGEPLLCMHRDLLCNYITQLASQPNNHTYTAVFHPTSCNRYEFQLLNLWLNAFKIYSDIQLPHIIPIRHPRVKP